MPSGATGEAFLTGLSRAHTSHPPSGIPFVSCGSDERLAVVGIAPVKPKTPDGVLSGPEVLAGISNIVLRRFPYPGRVPCSVTGRLTQPVIPG